MSAVLYGPISCELQGTIIAQIDILKRSLWYIHIHLLSPCYAMSDRCNSPGRRDIDVEGPVAWYGGAESVIIVSV